MSILVCDNLTFLYGQGTPFETTALSDVSFHCDEGEIVGVIGHTGSGKSTLIQHLNGLIKPHQGVVMLDGTDIWSRGNDRNIRQVRFAVGVCFQYPEYQIFEETVFKEIAYGPGQMGLPADEIECRVLQSLDYVDLSRDILSKSPFDLSGGQKRRVAIASIIAMKPRVLVLDEPCAGLDPKGRSMILDMVRSYQQEEGNSVLLVSHSMEDIASIADRVLVMNNGRVAMCGTVDDIFTRGRELRDMGLNVPEVTDVFLRLHDMGVDCRTDIFTVEQGVREFDRLRRMGGVPIC